MNLNSFLDKPIKEKSLNFSESRKEVTIPKVDSKDTAIFEDIKVCK